MRQGDIGSMSKSCQLSQNISVDVIRVAMCRYALLIEDIGDHKIRGGPLGSGDLMGKIIGLCANQGQIHGNPYRIKAGEDLPGGMRNYLAAASIENIGIYTFLSVIKNS